jgi:hypothetical protein
MVEKVNNTDAPNDFDWNSILLQRIILISFMRKYTLKGKHLKKYNNNYC